MDLSGVEGLNAVPIGAYCVGVAVKQYTTISEEL